MLFHDEREKTTYSRIIDSCFMDSRRRRTTLKCVFVIPQDGLSALHVDRPVLVDFLHASFVYTPRLLLFFFFFLFIVTELRTVL